MPDIFGYVCVLAADQHRATQPNDLTRAGCTRIFQEQVSGTRTSSPALAELLGAAREGDVVVVNHSRQRHLPRGSVPLGA